MAMTEEEKRKEREFMGMGMSDIFPSPMDRWKRQRKEHSERKIQRELAVPTENLGTQTGKFLKDIAIPSIGKGVRSAAGLATLVPRSFAKVGGDIYRGATGQPESTDEFKVFPFNQPALEEPEFVEQNTLASDVAAPSNPSLQEQNEITEPQPLNRQSESNKPLQNMVFNNKIDQDNYDKFGLKEMMRPDNPSMVKSLMTVADTGKKMVRETMNGGRGAPTQRDAGPFSLYSGGGGIEGWMEQNRTNAAMNLRDLSEWQSRNNQKLPDFGQQPQAPKDPKIQVLTDTDDFGNKTQSIYGPDAEGFYINKMRDVSGQLAENHPSIAFLRNDTSERNKRKFKEKYGYLPSWAATK